MPSFWTSLPVHVSVSGVVMVKSPLPFSTNGQPTMPTFAALALVSAVLAPMWRDYVVVLMNARGDRATLLWVVYEIPLLAIPLLIGWRGPRVQGSDRTVSASIEHPRTAPDELRRGLTG